jgi:hypothetical protein
MRTLAVRVLITKKLAVVKMDATTTGRLACDVSVGGDVIFIFAAQTACVIIEIPSDYTTRIKYDERPRSRRRI